MLSFRSNAPCWLKRLAWDVKHRHSHLEAPSEIVTRILEQAPRRVLDFGCGNGNLLRALRQGGWRGRYSGVDISERAICIAQESGDPLADWIVSPIEEVSLCETYDAICFVESIYYLPLRVAKCRLEECLKHLDPDGTVHIRICSKTRHAEYIAMIQEIDSAHVDLHTGG